MQAIELKFKEIQRFICQEKQSMNKAKTLISACSKQRDQLQYISTHLPTRLPEAATSKPLQQTAGTSAPAKDSTGEEVSDADENLDTANVDPQPTARAANDKKKRPKAPRRFCPNCYCWATAECIVSVGLVKKSVALLHVNELWHPFCCRLCNTSSRALCNVSGCLLLYSVLQVKHN